MWCSLNEAVKRAELPITLKPTVVNDLFFMEWATLTNVTEGHEQATRAYTQLRDKLLAEEIKG